MAPAATQEPPSVPPRPSRSQEKDTMPKIPPRPLKSRIDRSLSPNPARFAPSPLNEGLYSPKSATFQHLSPGDRHHNRRQSVEVPSQAGEEGREYDSLAEQLSSAYSDMSSSPEQTRTVGDDVKIHAPKPSLPAQSAKQRVMTVTRTDSDKAASFGIGKPSSDDNHAPSSNHSLKKKASTISQLSTTESHDDEHGIPEIGQQVPMFPNAGDVQAPSPAPGSEAMGKNHKRRTSARGNLPPGSYGLHGHGLHQPHDKLEKQYFQKHPDLLKREHTPHHYDRPYDFSMSSEDLNKIVRETASHGSGIAVKNYTGTPTDSIGWQAIEESTSRVTSPRPASAAPRSPSKGAARPGVSGSSAEEVGHRGPEEGNVIHVDDPNGRRRSVMFSDEETPAGDNEDEPVYTAPILAEDEILKGPASDTGPAVEPRRGSFIDEDGYRSSSRPSSRPGSLYKVESHQSTGTPLEDVEEYEPLFPEEEGKEPAKKTAPEPKLRPQGPHKQRFPSRDIWEDAPDSVHYTVEVSTPEIPEEKEQEEQRKPTTSHMPVPREGESPAQAFARHQEELAEQEARKNGPDTFLKNGRNKPSWAQHQLASESSRPSMAQRFPSRDIWEDTPESQMLQAEVSTPQEDREVEAPADSNKPSMPDHRPVRKTTDPSTADKPAVPERPKPKSASQDDSGSAPPTRQPSIPDRPKPQIPARPVKASPTSGGQEPAEAAAPPKQKPAVPLKAVGSKIAALQGSFLNDLNKKLGLGPQAPKKEEPAAEEEDKPAEEKAPLSDARKSRARGPQRRAPAAKSPAPSGGADEQPKFSLGFAVPSTIFEVDPDEEDDVVKLGHAVPEEAPSAKAETAPLEESAPPKDTDQLPGAFPTEETAPAKETAPAEGEETTQKEKDEQPKTTEASPSNPPEPEKVVSVSEERKPVTATEDAVPKPAAEPVREEKKSLVTNEAGDTVLAEDLKVDDKKQEVEPTAVED